MPLSVKPYQHRKVQTGCQVDLDIAASRKINVAYIRSIDRAVLVKVCCRVIRRGIKDIYHSHIGKIARTPLNRIEPRAFKMNLELLGKVLSFETLVGTAELRDGERH